MIVPALLILTLAPGGEPPVEVIVDMDAGAPGIQHSITVDACTPTVGEIAVFIRDPLGARSFYWIGYAGGVDRGIAFGHVPDERNAGTVLGISGTAGPPLNPGNANWLIEFVDPAFAGPEVQYREGGAPEPAVIPADPAAPVFTVEVTLADAEPGDRYALHLLDFVSVWTGFFGGSFSTREPGDTFDTGGDAVPDGTVSLYGVDADEPALGGAFLVDYIDGPPGGGPAEIVIVAGPADVTADGGVDVDDLVGVITAWGAPGGPADVNRDGIVNVADLVAVITAWGTCG